MAWAVGNLGYSLALHRLRKGTETMPSPSSCPTNKHSVKNFNATLYHVAPFTVVVWTLVIVLVVNLETITNELNILIVLSYFGWFHFGAWLIILILVYLPGFPLKEQMGWLVIVPALLIWMPVSPLICIVSQILVVLCHLMLMMALDPWLPSFGTILPFTCISWRLLHQVQQLAGMKIPLLNRKILEDKIGPVKSDPKLGACSYCVAV
jgi:uncharacterized membrane protein YesL